MRILYDSKKTIHKAPFGCITPHEPCRLTIHIPDTAQAVGAECVVCHENGGEAFRVEMPFEKREAPYDIYTGELTICQTGLYFYYFYIRKADGGFRLFKQGDSTNMEAGDLWQLSCIPADFTTPDWAKGAVIYQVFPDRFYKAGECDLTGKLTPYTVHENWDEGRGAQQRLLWRQFPGHHRETGLHRLFRRYPDLLKSHQQKLFLPPVRHR